MKFLLGIWTVHICGSEENTHCEEAAVFTATFTSSTTPLSKLIRRVPKVKYIIHHLSTRWPDVFLVIMPRVWLYFDTEACEAISINRNEVAMIVIKPLFVLIQNFCRELVDSNLQIILLINVYESNFLYHCYGFLEVNKCLLVSTLWAKRWTLESIGMRDYENSGTYLRPSSFAAWMAWRSNASLL